MAVHKALFHNFGQQVPATLLFALTTFDTYYFHLPHKLHSVVKIRLLFKNVTCAPLVDIDCCLGLLLDLASHENSRIALFSAL